MELKRIEDDVTRLKVSNKHENFWDTKIQIESNFERTRRYNISIENG